MPPEHSSPLRAILVRAVFTLVGLLVLYPLTIGPVDYYLGYQFMRDGGRNSSTGPINPGWYDTLYQPLNDAAEAMSFDAFYYYRIWWGDRGFAAGEKAYEEHLRTEVTP
jgi:hypothetical protein